MQIWPNVASVPLIVIFFKKKALRVYANVAVGACPGVELFGARRPERVDGQAGAPQSLIGRPRRRQRLGQLHVRRQRRPSGLRRRPRPQR